MPKNCVCSDPALYPHACSCSNIHELGKALGPPSPASPGVLLPTRQKWNPGRNGHCGTKADPKESHCCHQPALPLEVGNAPGQDCQQRCPECYWGALAKAWQLQLASSAVRFAPAQPRCVSPSVPASGTTTTSKPQGINDLVSQSFAASLWPKAANSYSALSYCKLPRAEQLGWLRNKNVVGISSWVKKWWLQPLPWACVSKHESSK